MCGIAGDTSGNASRIAQMLARIAHRGPDGSGVNGIHGHVRLALRDLSSASAQPFLRGGSVLSFNGELWNFRELRQELQSQGQQFTTTGDTEVLAAMLDVYGIDCLPKLDGMFAFSWSGSDGSCWLARDAFGKVPLYITRTKGGYQWASERKAFTRGQNPIAVPPGYAFDLKRGEWRAWYQLPEPKPLSSSQVLGLLRAGVAKRLDADALSCVLVSGGIDSSIILALAKEAKPDIVAFTAVFNGASDDASSARRICRELKVKLVEVQVKISDRLISDAIRAIEIPSKAQIEIAALCLPLAQRIYAEGFRACLSGEASDELFGGYGNFCIKAAKATDKQIIALRKEQLTKMARGNFIRCNKAFMAHGIECRLPFMEQALVESAVQLGKEDSPPGKKLLKRACVSVLPDWVIRRAKDTFQGGSGLSQALAKKISSPVRFYNAETQSFLGYLSHD